MKIPILENIKEKHEALVKSKDVNAVEDVSKRLPKSKTYITSTGFVTTVGGEPIHYEDDDGSLKDIELVFNGNQCHTAPYKVNVDPDVIGYEYISRKGGSIIVSLNNVDGQKVKIDSVSSNKNNFIWIANGITFTLSLKTDGVEIFKTLDANSPRNWTWDVSETGNPKLVRRTRGVDAGGSSVRMITEVLNESNGTFQYKETWTGEVGQLIDKAESKTRQKDWFPNPVYPVVIDVTTSDDITTTNDDGLERMAYNSWDQEPYTTYSTNIWGFPNTGGKWHGGLRFQTVNVPQGATINSATLTMKVTSVTGTPQNIIYGDDVDDAAAWVYTGDAANRPSGITKTTASTTWNETTTGDRVVTVTSIVQEIVNRAGWTANNDIRFAIINQNATLNHRVLVKDLKAGATEDVVLAIDYTAGGAVTVPTPRLLMMGVG